MKTKLTPTQINKKLYDAYQKKGATAVYDLANKFGLPYSPCKECDADTPSITHVCTVCGVCGQVKPKQLGTMYWKDEGSYFTSKLTKDDQPIDPKKLYEYGSLKELAATNKKWARKISKGYGFKAVFE